MLSHFLNCHVAMQSNSKPTSEAASFICRPDPRCANSAPFLVEQGNVIMGRESEVHQVDQ